MKLFRENAKAFRQQHDLSGADGNLAGFGLKHLAADTDDIADIHFLKGFIRLLADGVACHIGLDAAL